MIGVSLISSTGNLVSDHYGLSNDNLSQSKTNSITSFHNKIPTTKENIYFRDTKLFDRVHSTFRVGSFSIPPVINFPLDREVFRAGDSIDINGTASGSGFQYYSITWGVGDDPIEWFNEGITLLNNGTFPINNATLGSWNTSGTTEASYYTINLTVMLSSDEDTSITVLIYLDPTLHENFPFGWPYKIQGTPITIWSPIALYDINKDGYQEIGFGTISTAAPGDNNYDFVIDHTGNVVEGWPIQMYGIQGASLTFSNIDKSTNGIEVIGGMWGDEVYVWHCDGTVMDGWPKHIDVSRSSATVMDIDGDADLEIILPTTDGGGLVYIFHHDGTLVDGWPITIGSPVRRGASVGDLDQDGFPEILFGDQEGYLYAYHHNGTPVDGWPQQAHDWIKNSPVLADIDCDGDLEIVVSSGFSQERVIGIWHHDGTMVNGWPRENGLPFVQPSVGDIDDDGDLEILTGGSIPNKPYARFYVWHHNGTLVDGWPIQFPWDETQKVDYIYAQPIIGDIDGDGDVEVIVGSYYDKLYAWHHNGTNVSGWPKIVGGAIDSTAALGDIDNDTKVEVVVAGGDGKVYVWDMKGAYNSLTMEWPVFQHDLQHTGCYHSRIGDNQPPTTPCINGQTNGKKGEEYIYNITGLDPDLDELYVIIEWGDNTSSGLLGPYEGKYDITMNHTWNEKGTYTIKARAKDHIGWSLWGTLKVTMPKGTSIDITPVLKQCLTINPWVFPILRHLFGL
jgi:hypothetical protein